LGNSSTFTKLLESSVATSDNMPSKNWSREQLVCFGFRMVLLEHFLGQTPLLEETTRESQVN
jgi:hypothetical protein